MPQNFLRGDEWSPEEDNLLRDCVAQRMNDKAIAPLFPNRTDGAIKGRRHGLGLQFYKVKRFSEEEAVYIKQAFLDHVLTSTIAEKLGRKEGDIQQFIFKQKLHRDYRKTVLGRKYGLDVLKLGDDPEVIKASLLEAQVQAREKAKLVEAEKLNSVLNNMLAEIASGVDRRVAFQTARLQGCTLELIGAATGITRERVRQITCFASSSERLKQQKFKPTPPRTVTCKMCGNDFTVRHQGRFLYCEGCKPKADKIAYAKIIARAEAHRKANPEKFNEYARQNYHKKKQQRIELEQLVLELQSQLREKESGTESGNNNSD
jgi:hypothetical protein